MEKIFVNNITIPYKIQVSSRAKRVAIRISEGNVKVSLPKGIPVRQARTFIEDKKEWILKHWQAQNAEQDGGRGLAEGAEGSEFPYLGSKLTLHIKEHEGKRIKVTREGSALNVFLPEGFSGENRSGRVMEAIKTWYKEEARRFLWDKLDYYAGVIGVEFLQFRLKEQKTRWGSCSAGGNINLNWRVIMAPEPVIDYLVIHELAHLRHLNHSQAFWRLVEAYLPEYRRWRKWLKEQGNALCL